MKQFTRAAVAFCLAASATVGVPAAPAVQQANGIEYVGGGIGEEARAEVEALRARFMLHNVFSEAGGAYVIADRVSVRDASGELLSVRDTGPLLLIGLRPGRYTVEAEYRGATQRQTVEVGSTPKTLHWRWPAATPAQR